MLKPLYIIIVARWPHGCRRQCSEVAVPALVGSNPTEGGGFFRRKETPPGHGCEERHSPDTTPRSAGFKSQAGWPPMDVVCCDIRVVSSRKRRGERVGVGSRGKYPGAPPHHKGKKKPSRPTFQNGLSDPDFRYRPRQFGERRGEIYKGGTDAMLEVRGYDRSVLCNRSWRTRGGRPNRLENHLRRIPTETSRRIKASFTRVIDPTLKRSNFVTLLDRRHPQGPLRRARPHTGLSLAEEPEPRSNTYLARKCRGEEGPRGLSEDTDGVIDQRRKKDSEDLPPAPLFPGLFF
ncbi:hypothetical protein GEV33_005904 [Tenebrio molitor]|uniref:Uncharacterized protein n=1 Tax=Tenebrio molitor TaxID=7067 RepID=A0A8J6HM03_TENMO|nr:hypothetical protein GEV33_005904 [Tenebrio molitor]